MSHTQYSLPIVCFHLSFACTFRSRIQQYGLFSLVPCSLYSLTYWFSLPQVCCCLPLANCLSTVYQPIFINRLFSFVKVPFLVTCLLLSYTSLLLPSSICHSTVLICYFFLIYYSSLCHYLSIVWLLSITYLFLKDCNGTQNHTQLIRNRTLDHLAKVVLGLSLVAVT